MHLSEWLRTMQCLLNELATIDFGYPMGQNIVVPPLDSVSADQLVAQAGLSSQRQIVEFYGVCGGLSLPAVHNGYFLQGLSLIADERRKDQPALGTGPLGGSIVTLGSDGGGGQFALRRRERDMLHLPPGRIPAGVYEGDSVAVKPVAPDFFCFLDRILSDVRAFVRDTPGHRFMI